VPSIIPPGSVVDTRRAAEEIIRKAAWFVIVSNS
jgi:hypothetical protein